MGVGVAGTGVFVGEAVAVKAGEAVGVFVNVDVNVAVGVAVGEGVGVECSVTTMLNSISATFS